MIYVRDKGQMCNNILQYAHVYAWARENGKSSISMRFAYKYRYFKICKTRGHNIFSYLLGKYGSKAGLIPIVDFDDSLPHEERLKRLRDARNVVAQGWNARFYEEFQKYKSEILQLFEFLPEVNAYAEKLTKGYNDYLKLGFHVRRGDYSLWYGGRYLYTHEQYALQIRGFAELHSDRKIVCFVCSNDSKTSTAEAYKNMPPNVEIIFSGGNPGEDLCLLSKADYLIGAPSTFSLVASMYHDTPLYWIENPEKRIEESDFQLFDTLYLNIK